MAEMAEEGMTMVQEAIAYAGRPVTSPKSHSNLETGSVKGEAGPNKGNNSWKVLLIVFGCLAVVCGVGAFVYFRFFSSKQ
jgi:hypothetical protein